MMTKEKKYTYYFYKLVCNDINVKEFYVGSTRAWRERKRNHKSNCNNKNSPDFNNPKYKTIRANGGWENWKMLEIENGIYTKREADAHEYDLMAKLKSTMNKQKCFESHLKCEHNKRKTYCKECKGSSICKHNITKANCKQCNGTSICEHDKYKARCKQCNGSQCCEHDYNDKNNCPYCNPYLCECGSWTTKAHMTRHFQTSKCKEFHMNEYGRIFI
jgi:hypothetical protein